VPVSQDVTVEDTTAPVVYDVLIDVDLECLGAPIAVTLTAVAEDPGPVTAAGDLTYQWFIADGSSISPILDHPAFVVTVMELGEHVFSVAVTDKAGNTSLLPSAG